MPRRPIERRDLIFWSVPAAIGCVALFLAYRAYRADGFGPPGKPTEVRLVDPCDPGRYRCRRGHVETTTGEHGDAGPLSCAWKQVAACTKSCVTDLVTLVGVDEQLARRQLCDPPKRPLALLGSVETFLDQPIADAGVCEGDGYQPTDEGFVQCIMRSAKDPTSAGVIVARAACRRGAVRTVDRTPRLIRREEAAAVWCVRDPIADEEPADASVDADATADAPEGG